VFWAKSPPLAQAKAKTTGIAADSDQPARSYDSPKDSNATADSFGQHPKAVQEVDELCQQ